MTAQRKVGTVFDSRDLRDVHVWQERSPILCASLVKANYKIIVGGTDSEVKSRHSHQTSTAILFDFLTWVCPGSSSREFESEHTRKTERTTESLICHKLVSFWFSSEGELLFRARAQSVYKWKIHLRCLVSRSALFEPKRAIDKVVRVYLTIDANAYGH